ncbi:hypothetical protein ACHAWF_004393 [Thalassiosira exigua]
MEILLAGFGDVVEEDNTANPMEVLQKYRPSVNQLLRECMDGVMEKVKKDGQEYSDGFIDCNEEAVKTNLGLPTAAMQDISSECGAVADMQC